MGFAEEHGIKAICFDVDGTFYPKWKMDLRMVSSSLFHLPFALKYNRMRQSIRREPSLRPLSKRDFAKQELALMYPDGKHTVDWFLEKEKHVFHERWERSFRHLKGFPFVGEALKKASEQYTLGVFSDFPVGSKLKALRIEPYFSYISNAEECGALKPSPVPFALMCQALKVRPEEVLYVGDSESKDIRGAQNAGMKACLISTRKKQSSADIVVSSWEEFAARVL